MAGTKAGGLRARDKNLANNPNFYRDLGRMGGSVRTTKGFGVNPELASRAGRKGGLRSRRSTNTETKWDKQPSTNIESSTKTPQTEALLQKSSSTSSNGGDLDRSEQSSRGSKLISRLFGRA